MSGRVPTHHVAVAHARADMRAPAKPRIPHIRLVGLDGGGGLTPQVEEREPDDSHVTVTVGDDGAVSVDAGGEDSEASGGSGRFDENLALRLDDNALALIASWVIEGAEADLNSRREWTEMADRAADYLGVRLQEPTSAVTADGTVSKGVATAMLEANIKLWGVARAELLPVGGPVKVRRDKLSGPQAPVDPTAASPAPAPADPSMGAAPPAPGGMAPPAAAAAPTFPSNSPSNDDLADALETDLNHYLTVTDRGYYADYTRMLRARPVIGNAFRKVYRDPLLRRPVSRWVKAQNFIFSNDCTVWEEAGRKTEIVPMRQSTMRRMQMAGWYRDIPLAHPTGQATPSDEAVAETEGISATPERPEDYEHTVYESYMELGSGTNASYIGDIKLLERDEAGKQPGYPLPYRVSVDLDSREVLEIRRDWKEGDEDRRAQRHYVRYGFIPGDGSMDWGLIHLVGNPEQGATMLQRAGIDASLFANFPGGLMAKGPGSRQSDTVLRQSPGEWKAIDAPAGTKLSDIFMPNPYKPPTPEMLALKAGLVSDIKAVAGLIDLPVGEGRIGNTPVGTIMSYIESVTMVPGAVHKDDHMTQQLEFEMLRELIAEEPEVLAVGKSARQKARSRQWTREELLDPELVPAADPNTPSQIHRLTKVQGLVTAGGLPQFGGIADNRAIWKDVVRVLAGDDGDAYTMPVPPAAAPPPDPRIVAAQIKAESEREKQAGELQQKQLDGQNRLTELAVEGRQQELDRQSDEVRAAIGEETARLKTAHDTANAAADRVVDHSHHVDQHGLAVDQHGLATQQAFSPPLTGDGSSAT